MEDIILNSTDEILKLLSEISLKGEGFQSNCLLDDALEKGFTDPTYLKAYGEDPDAYYQGNSPAWAVYHLRQWKRVFMIYGGPGQRRRTQLTETP